MFQISFFQDFDDLQELELFYFNSKYKINSNLSLNSDVKEGNEHIIRNENIQSNNNLTEASDLSLIKADRYKGNLSKTGLK